MATAAHHTNGAIGANGVNGIEPVFPPMRFSKVPPTIVVAVAEAEGPYDIEIPLEEDIQEDPTELCTLLENEQSAKSTWMTVAIAYARHKKVDVAIEVLTKTIGVFSRARAEDRLSILNGLCWLYLLKCRQAPRTKSDGKVDDDVKTKDFYIQAATQVLNDASRISPTYGPLYLARGVLYLLRASLQGPSTAAGPNSISAERVDTLKQAAKCFEDALRASHGKNLMAKLGKARVNYSLGKYADALKLYQNVLESSPGLTDPDPRIGIGCCFWQLGFREDAAGAWQRSLDLNPKSKIALSLLGIYTFFRTAQLPPSNPKFLDLTKKAMSQYVAPSFQQDNMFPLTCATLGSWYVARKALDKVDVLSRRAIELTDVNDIASDGWYQLARKEHQEENFQKAVDFYARSDRARGGDDRGYIPAKFGSAQMRVQMMDYDGAKFRLEKILQQQSTLEAQILLGTLYAEDVFNGQLDEKTTEQARKKALKYLEDVSKAWKDPRKNLSPDQSVLLNLARLYEVDHPEKSLKCLEEVEQLELDAIPGEDYPEEIDDPALLKVALRELLPPQLLNNMGCFHYQHERYLQARELFQAALNACIRAGSRDVELDTDALVTSISYNLGRTYECEGMQAEAKDVYDSLLSRHAEYVDARIRLAYIALRQSPNDEGPKAVKALIGDKQHKNNLEVRALYGWYVNRSKRRQTDPAADEEQRHWKYTLQGNEGKDKHDQYALIGLGNVFLSIAREMPRDTEKSKDQRRRYYEKAAEFFEKVLQLEPKNAYAAQGIAIILAEDRKDYSTALQILSKVKETVKDYTVYMNLGHTFCELKQYPRAIENYEIALSKDRQHDPTILACLGRVWLLRGKAEKSASAMRKALEYSNRAYDISDQIHFKFNIAFVQITLAQLIHTLPEAQRTVAEVKQAAEWLDEAIDSFDLIANDPNPPFPKNDIEQRANMGRNTMRKQLERALENQQKYESANQSKLEAARALREAEQKKKDDERRQAEEAAAERRRKIQEDQQRLQERDREYMERRRDDEQRRREEEDEKELGRIERSAHRKKGGKRKKNRDIDDSDSEGGYSDSGERPRKSRRSASGTEGLSDEERPRQKKRKLARKKEPVGKYKSNDFIEDSDLEADAADEATPAPVGGDESGDEDADVSAPRARKARAVVSEDEDEDDDAVEAPAQGNGDVPVDDDDEDE